MKRKVIDFIHYLSIYIKYKDRLDVDIPMRKFTLSFADIYLDVRFMDSKDKTKIIIYLSGIYGEIPFHRLLDFKDKPYILCFTIRTDISHIHIGKQSYTIECLKFSSIKDEFAVYNKIQSLIFGMFQ